MISSHPVEPIIHIFDAMILELLGNERQGFSRILLSVKSLGLQVEEEFLRLLYLSLKSGIFALKRVPRNPEISSIS